MSVHNTSVPVSQIRRNWREVSEDALRQPVLISTNGRTRHVLMGFEEYERLTTHGSPSNNSENIPTSLTSTPKSETKQLSNVVAETSDSGIIVGHPKEPHASVVRFNVLCRIDAYADYVAEVEADSAEEAAELALDNHSDYTWEHDQTAEFDARFYVTLDSNGNEIEETQCGDF